MFFITIIPSVRAVPENPSFLISDSQTAFINIPPRTKRIVISIACEEGARRGKERGIHAKSEKRPRTALALKRAPVFPYYPSPSSACHEGYNFQC